LWFNYDKDSINTSINISVNKLDELIAESDMTYLTGNIWKIIFTKDEAWPAGNSIDD